MAKKKNVILEFNHLYNVKGYREIIIKSCFLEYEEIYNCDVNVYDANGWSVKYYTNEPFTLKEICDMLDFDYKTVIKPEVV